MECNLCHKESNSFVHCHKHKQLICHDHCETCEYFNNEVIWMCLYEEAAEASPPPMPPAPAEPIAAPAAPPVETFGSRVVEKFRKRMTDLNQQIAEKKKQGI